MIEKYKKIHWFDISGGLEGKSFMQLKPLLRGGQIIRLLTTENPPTANEPLIEKKKVISNLLLGR